MSEELAYLSATEMVERFARKKLSPVEITEAALNRIAWLNPKLNAFLLVDADKALAQARESERRWAAGKPQGLLDGVPVSIKDLVLTKGWPTLRGSRAVDPNQPWLEDAPAVARLREHGAVILGKTTTPEFGHKGVTDSPLSGITRNPWNLDKTPGGSSGGASAAIAAGLGPLAIGTDGGGSIRIPSSFAGIYGIKPTYGRVPSYPLSPFGTLSHVGPMTRVVADAALLLTVIAAPDWRDWHALPADPQDYRRDLDAGIKGLRVAYSPTLGLADVPLEPEVRALTDAAADSFASLGAKVSRVDPDWPHDPAEVFLCHWTAGAAFMLGAFSDAQRAVMDPTLLEFGARGRRYSGIAIKEADYRRGALGLAFNRLMQDFDLLLSPTLPIPAFAVGTPYPSPDYAGRELAWIPFTYPFNLTRNPAASVPCGFTASGLPVGLQIVGPLYGDRTVLRASRAYERANPFHERRPQL